MFEKVNLYHPDKVADRISGAVVDAAYRKQVNPKVACEVLLGHGLCTVIIETSVDFSNDEIIEIVKRIAGEQNAYNILIIPQDIHLANNQSGKIRCGDNGIFRGNPISVEQLYLSCFAKKITSQFPYDGKYILSNNVLTVCQSNMSKSDYDMVKKMTNFYCADIKINPLGEWSGGTSVDSGATNRKLGSDMGDAVTGGGLHGKDLSKADVSVNIYAHLLAQKTGKSVELCCSIGDESINGIPYSEIVETAAQYISDRGGFEKFAEWGLIY